MITGPFIREQDGKSNYNNKNTYFVCKNQLSERVQSGGQRKPGEEEPGERTSEHDPERRCKHTDGLVVKKKRPARKGLSAWGFMQDGAFPSRRPEERRRS